MWKTVAILSVGGFIVSVSYAILVAQATTASAGVYTAEQATRGEAVYKEQCAACHGDNLEGSGPMPPLAGMDFLTNWQGKTLGDLYEKTQTTMPATAPGTLTTEQTADVLAFMLKSNTYMPGSKALEGKMEVLLAISLDAPSAQPVAAGAVAGGATGASAGGAAGAGAGGARMVSEGVYTSDQATKGEAIYKEQCAACHGDNLEGSGPMPPLAGSDFLMNWKGKTLGDLYEKTQMTMPATAPGTLTPEQAVDVLAFILQSSKYTPGTTALVGQLDVLLPISIDEPK